MGAGSSASCPIGWVCAPGGTATSTCLTASADGTTPPPNLECALGSVCIEPPAGSAGTCEPTCGAVAIGGSCPPENLRVCEPDGGKDGG
jgi:hypothetical protein